MSLHPTKEESRNDGGGSNSEQSMWGRLTIQELSDYGKRKLFIPEKAMKRLKKSHLISVIATEFLRNESSVRIQRVFRGHLIRQWNRLSRRSEFAHKSSMIVNTEDFYSLAPLSFSSSEDKASIFYLQEEENSPFVYAFLAESLDALVQTNYLHGSSSTTTILRNPYTRNPLHGNIYKQIILFLLLHYSFVDTSSSAADRRRRREFYKELVRRGQSPGKATTSSLREENLINKRQLPMDMRIRELFIDIDVLGNYTDSRWFFDLSWTDLLKFWTTLYDIWLYRGQIPSETKRNICPLQDPFQDHHLLEDLMNNYHTTSQIAALRHDVLRISLNHRRIHSFDGGESGENESRETIQLLETFPVHRMRDYCLFAMENMIHSSNDVECRKLGAMYVLAALVKTSYNARCSLPWLMDVVLVD
jgi:hypothetical protein